MIRLKTRKLSNSLLTSISNHSYCSPRINARRTAEILRLGTRNHLHFLDRETGQTFETESQVEGDTADANIHVTKWLEEWDFGDYEGLTLQSIKDARMKKFGDPTWDIWREGCPGGEYVLFPLRDLNFLGGLMISWQSWLGVLSSKIGRHGLALGHEEYRRLTLKKQNDPFRTPQQVTNRVDELIAEIKSVIEANSATWPGGQMDSHRSQHAQDIVCVAHGHILATMAIRWVGLSLDTGTMRLIFEPGGVGVLG